MLSLQPNVSSYFSQPNPASTESSVEGEESDTADIEVEAQAEINDLTQNGFLNPQRMRVYGVKEEIVPHVGVVHFRTAFESTDDGLKATVVAPMGLRMRVTWRVCGASTAETETQDAKTRQGDEGRMLSETCEITVNAMLMPFVEWQFRKAHESMLASVVKEAETGEEQGSAEREER